MEDCQIHKTMSSFDDEIFLKALNCWAGMIKKKEDTGNNFSVSSLSIGVISVDKAFCSLLYLFKVGINHIIVGFSSTPFASSHFRAATRFLPSLFLRGLRIHDLG